MLVHGVLQCRQRLVVLPHPEVRGSKRNARLPAVSLALLELADDGVRLFIFADEPVSVSKVSLAQCELWIELARELELLNSFPQATFYEIRIAEHEMMQPQRRRDLYSFLQLGNRFVDFSGHNKRIAESRSVDRGWFLLLAAR